MKKPEQGEFNPYYQTYIDNTSDSNYFDSFDSNTEALKHFFSNINTNKHEFRYQDSKWTIKQVLMHIIDTERVFAYRLLVILRADKTTQLQSYNDQEYMQAVDVSGRSMESLVQEFASVRANTRFLLENTKEEQSTWSSSVMDVKLSARAIAYIVLGHAQHHMQVVKDRYL
jgi:uncharacterized damage-inducible protein DinB